MNVENIILIGMPGAGKSTVGVVLAKKLGFQFLDSDLVIQEKYGKCLHELIEQHGIDGFQAIENEVNCSIHTKRTVIATGGSAIYGAEAMEHFTQMGDIVYLQLTYSTVQDRLGDLHKRGVTMQPGQTLEELYKERVPLYEKYAHTIIDCEQLVLRQVVESICQIYRN